MSQSHNPLEANELQQATQRAWYRAGLIKLNERFEPWSDYLQYAIQTAALYGISINEAEAEGAIECLFEVNPKDCWQLLCHDFALADHPAFIRGLLCDRYPFHLLRFSTADARFMAAALQTHCHRSGLLLSWAQIDHVVICYLQLKGRE